jgi:hypothetical protein
MQESTGLAREQGVVDEFSKTDIASSSFYSMKGATVSTAPPYTTSDTTSGTIERLMSTTPSVRAIRWSGSVSSGQS